MDANATLLFALLALQAVEPEADTAQAWRAYYKSSGLEATALQFERERVPPALKAYVGPAAWLTKTAVDQKITFKWSF